VDREEIVASRPRRYYRLIPAPRRQPAPDLRAGDADREAAATALAEHFAQGHQALGELIDRLEVALTATMQSEIARVTRDLPRL
jgi:hypothetical protein